MSKKTLAVIIILIVVVIVVFGVFAFHNRAKAPVAGVNPVPTAPGITVQASSTGSSTVSIMLTTSTQKMYANSSFSFNYPAAWSIAMDIPFSITNFGDKYNADGTIPSGSAVIAVVTSTVEQGYVPSIMNTQLMGAMNIATTTLTVSGVACPAAAFEAAYAPGATSKNVSVYCERGSELWEIYLSYGASDPAASVHVSDFNGILDSMKFLP